MGGPRVRLLSPSPRGCRPLTPCPLVKTTAEKIHPFLRQKLCFPTGPERCEMARPGHSHGPPRPESSQRLWRHSSGSLLPPTPPPSREAQRSFILTETRSPSQRCATGDSLSSLGTAWVKILCSGLIFPLQQGRNMPGTWAGGSDHGQLCVPKDGRDRIRNSVVPPAARSLQEEPAWPSEGLRDSFRTWGSRIMHKPPGRSASTQPQDTGPGPPGHLPHHRPGTWSCQVPKWILDISR